MAIGFASLQPIRVSSGNVLAASAYIGRQTTRDHLRGETYSFSHRSDELLSSGIFAPDDAPEWVSDAEQLWNRALEAEITRDRKTGELRFRRNAGREPQVAMSYMLALPKELNADQNTELLSRYLDDRFSKSGVAVQWAIHRDEKGTGNIHAHLLVTTRGVTEDGFNRNKARELNPDFLRGQIAEHEKSKLKDGWKDFQNAFFREKGWELEVDPDRAIPDIKLGTAQYVNESEREAHRKALAERQREIARDDDATLAHLTKNDPTFTARALESYLRKSGLSEDEVAERKDAVLSSARVIRLEEERRLASRDVLVVERFTTQDVLEHEVATIDAALHLHATQGPVLDVRQKEAVLRNRDLTAEQKAAFEQATGAQSLAIIKGRAGTGKSYTVDPIREAYEREGHRVIGLAPTNIVAADMRAAGFSEGSTVAAELMRQDGGHRRWDRHTVLIVDEAAMVSARDMGQILDHAAQARAKIILVGDERQLQSVERGGIFEEIAQRTGAAELSQVYRQKDQWAKDASQSAAQGRVADAIRQYDERGAVRWSEQTEDARAQLVRDWQSEAARGPAPAVYASTNTAVDQLNRELRAARIEMGQIDRATERTFSTVRGEVETETTAAVGDRILFTATVKDRAEGLELRNGEAAVIEAIDGDRITVKTDLGRRFAFDAAERQGWQLGYATTIYKGQGKTNERVLAFYDNGYVWRANTSYVALTRHKAELRVYAGRDIGWDIDKLGRAMSRDPGGRAALSFRLAKDQHRTPDRAERPIAAGRAPETPEARRAAYEAERARFDTGSERGPATLEERRAAFDAARAAHSARAPSVEERRAAFEASRARPAEERSPKTPDQREATRERTDRMRDDWER